MKKLKKISLSDVKVMDAQEMKMILGGQFFNDFCRITSGSGGIVEVDGTGTLGDDVVCGGRCPTETVTGNTSKQTCQKDVAWSGDHTSAVISCICK